MRSVVDAAPADGMGTACTRVEERTSAAFGVCDGAPVRFEFCLDVPNGGVLCALPALFANGLLEQIEQYESELARLKMKLKKAPTVDMAAARRLLQDPYVTEADILPRPKDNLLHVRVHNASRPAANESLTKLFDELNAAEVCYPGSRIYGGVYPTPPF